MTKSHSNRKATVTAMPQESAMRWPSPGITNRITSTSCSMEGTSFTSSFPTSTPLNRVPNFRLRNFSSCRTVSDCGWPYCYYDEFQQKKVLAPEYGGDGKKVGRCEGKTDPILAFPGHLAPNDLLFYTGDQFPDKYKHGAFIAFHGSWNRSPEPQEGFYVAFVPFKGDYPSGKWEVFANGFAETDTIRSPGDAKYRPCGLAQGPDGSLFVVDSNEGKVWRIAYNMNENQ